MPRFTVETTTDQIAWSILEGAGVYPTNERQLEHNLKSSKANMDNLVATGDDEQELVFAEDGMPLIGVFSNSYDNAAGTYARSYVSYPRNDSPSRGRASNNGAVMNEGAAKHLDENYGDMMTLLRALSLTRQEETFDVPIHDTNTQKVYKALDVLNGAVSMWSYMKYRKEGRVSKDKLPLEVGLLHRSMSGVRMSLLGLFVRDGSHSFRPTEGWTDKPLTVETWLEGVEKADRLIGASNHPKQLCPAPTNMIRRVLEAVVEPIDSENSPRVADLEVDYGVRPEAILAYGKHYYELEQARAERSFFVGHAMAAIMEVIGGGAIIKQSDVNKTKLFLEPHIRAEATRMDTRMKRGFMGATALLGYKPTTFDNLYKGISAYAAIPKTDQTQL
jgi:hypothetical protein